jgi:hypothetical protein
LYVCKISSEFVYNLDIIDDDDDDDDETNGKKTFLKREIHFSFSPLSMISIKRRKDV